MGGVPFGIRISRPVFGLIPIERNTGYRVFILVFTFLIYTSYHLSRKPISVVKTVLGQNCTNQNGTEVSNCTSWPPFDGENSKELLGTLDYAFLFSYAIGMFVSGHIADRTNLRYFLATGMLLSGAFTALFGVARYAAIHNLIYFIAVQLLGGFVQATGWPCVVTCVANWFGKGKRGFIMGVWNSHTSVGNILGSVIAGEFAETNWGLSFIIPGIIIASMGVLVLFFLVPNPLDAGCDLPYVERNFIVHPDAVDADADEGPTTGQILHPDDCDADGDEWITATQPEINVIVKEEEPLLQANNHSNSDSSQILESRTPEKAISFIGALKIPGVVEFSLCLFFAKLVSYTFLFWLPSYIQISTPYTPEQSADLSTLFDVGGIVGGITAGVVSDITGGRATPCVVMLFLASPMLLIYRSFGTISLTVNIVLLLICGFLVNGPYALITTAVSADLGTHKSLMGSSKALATVTAIIDGTGSLGAAIGPLLTGLISPTGWNNVFYMLIFANICALMLLLRLVVKEIKTCMRRAETTL